MIVLRPETDGAWAALKNALAADIFTAVHLTLTASNQTRFEGYLKRLAQLGTPAVSLSAANPDLQDALQTMRDTADTLQLSLVWDLPVPYSELNPVRLEVAGDRPAQGAGRAWLYVEPDGDVLSAQGENRVLGNILRDTWETIWASV
jgi:MoaA/NifB/PqqE/SkfB family radical SAM enzyme